MAISDSSPSAQAPTATASPDVFRELSERPAEPEILREVSHAA